jgi:hypothetical protein
MSNDCYPFVLLWGVWSRELLICRLVWAYIECIVFRTQLIAMEGLGLPHTGHFFP